MYLSYGPGGSERARLYSRSHSWELVDHDINYQEFSGVPLLCQCLLCWSPGWGTFHFLSK